MCKGVGPVDSLLCVFLLVQVGNSNPITDTERIQVAHYLGGVQFAPVNRQDEGDYECRATNDVGTDSVTGRLVVHGVYCLRLD